MALNNSISSEKAKNKALRIHNLKHAFLSIVISLIISTVVFWSLLFALVRGPAGIIGVAYFLYILPLHMIWSIILLSYAAFTKRTLNYKRLTILPFLLFGVLFAIWTVITQIMLRQIMNEPQNQPGYYQAAPQVSMNTYIDPKNRFSFDYQINLRPLELSSGVVTFLPSIVYDVCKKGLETKDAKSLDTCRIGMFNLTGFEISSTKSYEAFTKANKGAAILGTYTDDKGRVWKTSLILGEVYNYDAFTTVNGKTIRISFQYSSTPPSQDKVINFFNQILSTLVLSI